ncbi:MAG: pseudouridine synthase [Cryomorphaceae bacterium]|nr:pseudouridine synthase [Flavobacteriales bacterium]
MLYYAVYKPFGMLSQFSPEGDKPTLAGLGNFPKDVYPVGRLDADSEGLLILTNDKRINSKLLHPEEKRSKTYYAQVEGDISLEAIENINRGVEITVKGKKYRTLPAKCQKISEPILPERNPPIRFRKNLPTSWISLRVEEGKNRQVRKMTAAVGFPTLRLVRWAVEELCIDGMKPGQVDSMRLDELKSKIHIRI